MGEQVKLQFRPSLIIFVGEAGREIREQFGPRGLLAYLDKSLRQSVALLQVIVDGNELDLDDDEVQLYAEPFLSEETSTADSDMPRERGLLQDVVHRALRSVQSERHYLSILKAGYAMPDPRTQIQIVGAAQDDSARWMARVLSVVREQVKRNHFNTTVSYFLNVYDPIAKDYSGSLKKPFDKPGMKWEHYELPNFSYLYQHIATYPTTVFANAAETQYATAEALVALTGTGITLSEHFENQMRQNEYLEDYSFNIGTLSTSMIMFPRTAASHFCSSRLNYDLMGKWHEDLEGSVVSANAGRELQAQARQAVENLQSWIEESDDRWYAPTSYSPNLRILLKPVRPDHPKPERVRYQQAELHHTLENQTKRLFGPLSLDSVMREFRTRRNKKEKWVEIADKRGGSTVDRYAHWEHAAKGAWDAANERIGDEIMLTVDELWPSTENGFERARIYVEAYYSALQQLIERVSRWKTDHIVMYEADQESFAKIAQGSSWATDEDTPNIMGDDVVPPGFGGQATPRWGQKDSPGGAGADISLAGQTSSALPDSAAQSSSGSWHLTDDEDKIAGDLGQRAEWKQRQVPPITALSANGFVMWLTTAFIITGVTSALHVEPLVTLAINAAVLLLLLGASLFYVQRRYREVQLARQELLAFYRRCYVFKCEKQEDFGRIDIMRKLIGRVGGMRRRLNNMSAFLLMMQQHAEQQGFAVQNKLFDGPSGSRDIFVANGERLQKEGLHTLENLFGQVTHLRVNHYKKDWHRTLDEMKNELIKEFRSIPESFIEASEEAVQQRLDRFTTNVVDAYLTGPLVDISVALDKPDIWEDAKELIGKPYYHTTIGIRDPHLRFVCGSQQDLNKSSGFLPADTITVQTKNPEWLLLGSFFRGGGPDALDAHKLFPVKKIIEEAPPTETDDFDDERSDSSFSEDSDGFVEGSIEPAPAYNEEKPSSEEKSFAPHDADGHKNDEMPLQREKAENDFYEGRFREESENDFRDERYADRPVADEADGSDGKEERVANDDGRLPLRMLSDGSSKADAPPAKPRVRTGDRPDDAVSQRKSDGTSKAKSSLLSYDEKLEKLRRIDPDEFDDE